MAKLLNLHIISPLNDLEELILKDFDQAENVESICKLRLRKIQISTTNMSQFLQNSAANILLEHLDVRCCIIDNQFIDGLSRFRNLRHLTLRDPQLKSTLSDLILQ